MLEFQRPINTAPLGCHPGSYMRACGGLLAGQRRSQPMTCEPLHSRQGPIKHAPGRAQQGGTNIDQQQHPETLLCPSITYNSHVTDTTTRVDN